MTSHESEVWHAKDIKYAKDLFKETRQSIGQSTFGESAMFYPYGSSSEDEDEDDQSAESVGMSQGRRLECTIHRKLAKYSSLQPSLVGYLVACFLYVVASCLLFKIEGKPSFFWLSLLAVLNLVTAGLFAFSVKWEAARFSGSVGMAMFGTRICAHLAFITNLWMSRKLPLLAKIALVRGSAMIPSTINVQFVGFSLVDISADLGIFAILSSEKRPSGDLATWTTLVLYVLAVIYHLYHRLWSAAIFEKMTSWVETLVEKLVINTRLYNALGGHPTIWQKSKTATLKRKPCFPDLELIRKHSSPNKSNRRVSSSKFVKFQDNMSDLNNLVKDKDEPNASSPKMRMSMTSEEISQILKDVFYTAKTKFEAVLNPEQVEEKEANFEASCSSFRMLMSKHVEKDGRLTMELVWEELINLVLANFDCVVNFIGLDLCLDGSPKCNIGCNLNACSIWSIAEQTRYFYSKLARKTSNIENDSEEGNANKHASIPAKKIGLKPLPILERNFTLNSILEQSESSIQKRPDDEVFQTPREEPPISPVQPKEPPFKSEELISVVVHDMRSPLMCILGNLELINFELRDKPNYALVEPLIKTSMSASALLENLVSDILDAARIAKGIFKINPSQMNLEETLKECTSTVYLAAKSRNVSLNLKYDASQRIISNDKHRIKQVILNFLSNSIKFTQNGDIWITVSEGSRTLAISIEDNGHGIAPEFLPQIFSKYKSDNKNKINTQGIGLGLFICKSLINMLGPKKEIKVKSQVGKGTTFTFEIYKDIDKNASPRELAHHEQSHLRKFAYGSMGCSNNKANSTKEIALLNSFSKPKSNMTIFALNNQSALESRRLIQTKMKWDISWITRFKDSTQMTNSTQYPNLTRTESDNQYMSMINMSNSLYPFKKISSSEVSGANQSRLELSTTHLNINDSDQLGGRLSVPLIKATLDEMSCDEQESFEVDLTVLIVDDEPFILDLLSDFFTLASAELHIQVIEDSASDIHTTSEKMNGRDYDLVIIDCYLPDGTGPDFVKGFIEQHKEGGKIPLFALSTGADMHEIPHKSLFFKILTKPITLTKFKELLEAVRDTKRSDSQK